MPNLNPRLDRFATVTLDLARAEADAMELLLSHGVWLRPLHGILHGLKILYLYQCHRGCTGVEPFQTRVLDRDAAVTTKLRAAGAVLIGKTTLGALAYNDLWYGGWTRNPGNPNEVSSGSSAGSASATAAGCAGFLSAIKRLALSPHPLNAAAPLGCARPLGGSVARALWHFAGH